MRLINCRTDGERQLADELRMSLRAVFAERKGQRSFVLNSISFLT